MLIVGPELATKRGRHFSLQMTTRPLLCPRTRRIRPDSCEICEVASRETAPRWCSARPAPGACSWRREDGLQFEQSSLPVTRPGRSDKIWRDTGHGPGVHSPGRIVGGHRRGCHRRTSPDASWAVRARLVRGAGGPHGAHMCSCLGRQTPVFSSRDRPPKDSGCKEHTAQNGAQGHALNGRAWAGIIWPQGCLSPAVPPPQQAKRWGAGCWWEDWGGGMWLWGAQWKQGHLRIKMN